MVNRKPLILGLVSAFGFGLLILAASQAGGPSSRCEEAGGHYMVGPGGESACVDRRTFLPMDGFDR